MFKEVKDWILSNQVELIALFEKHNLQTSPSSMNLLRRPEQKTWIKWLPKTWKQDWQYSINQTVTYKHPKINNISWLHTKHSHIGCFLCPVKAHERFFFPKTHVQHDGCATSQRKALYRRKTKRFTRSVGVGEAIFKKRQATSIPLSLLD